MKRVSSGTYAKLLYAVLHPTGRSPKSNKAPCGLKCLKDDYLIPERMNDGDTHGNELTVLIPNLGMLFPRNRSVKSQIHVSGTLPRPSHNKHAILKASSNIRML